MNKNAPRPLAKTATLELFVVSPTETPNSKPATRPTTNAAIYLVTPAVITTADVATVQPPQDPLRLTSLVVNLTPSGATKLATATANPKGMQLAFLLNGTIVSVVKVKVPLQSAFEISGARAAKQGESLFETLTRD